MFHGKQLTEGHMNDMSEAPKHGTICGRSYHNQLADFADVRGCSGRGKARFIVEGVTHPKGQPIRFKSLRRAENHIINMRLVKKE
jgi:hypothetical protein